MPAPVERRAVAEESSSAANGRSAGAPGRWQPSPQPDSRSIPEGGTAPAPSAGQTEKHKKSSKYSRSKNGSRSSRRKVIVVPYQVENFFLLSAMSYPELMADVGAATNRKRRAQKRGARSKMKRSATVEGAEALRRLLLRPQPLVETGNYGCRMAQFDVVMVLPTHPGFSE